MIALRLAAVVAALVTITLNAHHGFKASQVFEYAVLFAALNAALDVAKCSCLAGMHQAWRLSRYPAALLLFLLFWPLFLNSLWCGLSEVAISRAGEIEQHVAASQIRARAEVDYQRLIGEMATMKASPTFAASAACALPKSQTAREYCSKLAALQTSIAGISAELDRTHIKDPEPQLTLVAQLTGWELPQLQLGVALWPVLLAELVGSVGFYLGAGGTPGRIGRNKWALWLSLPPKHAPAAKNDPEPRVGGLETPLKVAVGRPMIGDSDWVIP